MGIPKKELISCHGYTHPKKLDAILQRLVQGQHLALVSDAGTPGISDPGFALVSRIVQTLCGTGWSGAETDAMWSGAARSADRNGSDFSGKRVPPRSTETNYNFHITPIPGPSAFLAALSASGLPIHQFLYLGFLPIKKGRQTLLQSLPREERTVVFYESVHRIERTLRELAEVFADQPHRQVVIARELTKLHEEILRVTVADLPNIASMITKKGEFVIVIGPKM
ncbi:rRNA small subunit methyltransferase 1 [Candidatus Peregrinibacteria bacterium]|nr:rRNA small subunit methyltransferase 1 [Candidatus Peregrinibacteria bacterium]